MRKMKIFRWRRDQDCRAARVEMLDRRRAGVKFAREEKARTRIIRGAAAPSAWPLYVIKNGQLRYELRSWPK